MSRCFDKEADYGGFWYRLIRIDCIFISNIVFAVNVIGYRLLLKSEIDKNDSYDTDQSSSDLTSSDLSSSYDFDS